MDDLDRQLRDAFDEPPPLTVDEVRTHTGAGRGPRRPVLVAALVALVVIAAGVVVFVARKETNDNRRIEVAATSTSTSVSSTSTTTAPNGATSGHATVRIDLNRTTAVANGTPILGTAVIDNQTGHEIDAPNGQCAGWLGVGLSNARIHYDFSVPSIACAPFKIPTGISRYPVSVSTQHSTCLQTSTSPDPNLPTCLGPDHNQSPPLPPGTYTAKVEGLPASIERPAPTTVTLTAP